MHLITIRDQVCNVMASLTKTLLSVPKSSCKTIRSRQMQHAQRNRKSISPQVGPTVRASAPCKREVGLDRLLEVAQLEVVVRMLSDRIQELVIAGFSNSKVPVVQWISESKAQAPLLLAQPFLHTSVMTLMIAVMFFSRK